MRIAHAARAGRAEPRAVAIGSFDGVHRGHRAVLDAVRATGLAPTVITFDPHPRVALGNRVDLLTTLERRLELLGGAGSRHDARRRVRPRAAATHARGVRRAVPARDRRRGRRRRGGLPLRRAALRRSRAARAARLRGRRSARSRASRRRRSERRSRTATSSAAARCSAGRSSSTASSSPATSEAARSAIRPRTCAWSPSSPCPATGSMPARRSSIAPRSRSGRTRTTAAPSAGSSRTSSTSRATSTASACSSSSGSGSATRRCSRSEEELVAQIARDVEATRQPAHAAHGRLDR